MTSKKHYRLYVAYKFPQVRLLDFRKIKMKVSNNWETIFPTITTDLDIFVVPRVILVCRSLCRMLLLSSMLSELVHISLLANVTGARSCPEAVQGKEGPGVPA